MNAEAKLEMRQLNNMLKVVNEFSKHFNNLGIKSHGRVKVRSVAEMEA
jgi:hypothetical protein